jgi:hypothetical protein
MKLLLLTPLILVWAISAHAQSSDQTDTPAGVAILKFSWHNRVRFPDSETPSAGDHIRAGELPSQDQNVKEPRSAATGKVANYTYEVRIRNDGEGTIKAIAWEYLFLDPGSGSPLARHPFRSFCKIESGKSCKLTGSSFGPPTRVISVAGANKKGRLFDERVIIKCVAYADGTVRWLPAASESDCADIKGGRQSGKPRDPPLSKYGGISLPLSANSSTDSRVSLRFARQQ